MFDRTINCVGPNNIGWTELNPPNGEGDMKNSVEHTIPRLASNAKTLQEMLLQDVKLRSWSMVQDHER